METTKMYRLKEVCNLTGLKPSTIYKLIRNRDFPQGVQLTKRSIAWPSTIVEDWLQKRIKGASNV